MCLLIPGLWTPQLQFPFLFLQIELSSVHSTHCPYEGKYNGVPITKLKSHSRTACWKLHPGDLHWSFVCSQTLQALIYRQSPGPLPQTANLISLFPVQEKASHCCPDCMAVIQQKKNLSASLSCVTLLSSLLYLLSLLK